MSETAPNPAPSKPTEDTPMSEPVSAPISAPTTDTPAPIPVASATETETGTSTGTGELVEPSGRQSADNTEQWKRHAREWERRAKRNSELAARYPDLEARAQSLEEQYEEAVGARARLEAELWRERAARAHGVPDDLFEFLTGSSEADVMERAERIAARVAGGPRRPLPDPTQGRGSPAPTSPADAFAAYVRDSLNR